jgi:D-amino peptidase
MKVFMMTDLEGVAGVTTFLTQTYADGKYYEQSRRLQTEEINAAVEGMIQAGVSDVLVADYHGPGAIQFELLHEKATLLHGRPGAPRSVVAEVLAEYDASVIVGQHAMAGVRDGNLNHTQSSMSTDYIQCNGRPIGEIAQWALYVGSFGIPVIYLTGDEAACREAVEFIPGIATVAVKKGVGRNAAISVSAVEARRRIREGAKAAIEAHRRQPVAPLVWDGPFVVERRFFHTDVADGAAERAGAERVDSQTVRWRSDDIRQVIYS